MRVGLHATREERALAHILIRAFLFVSGGGALGFGICMLWIVRFLPPVLPQATTNILNYRWIVILLGMIMTVFGCVEVYRAYSSMKTEAVAKPNVEGKFFCRYCGKENKPDAIYCEVCGKKL